MTDCMDEPRLMGLLRTVRDNLGSPAALIAASEIADEVRRLRDALDLSEAIRAKLEADLREAIEQTPAERDLFGDAVRVDPKIIERLDS